MAVWTGDWYRRMSGRRSDEEHRASTPLELFFDLCFVVAVAQASSRLHYAVTEGQVGHALFGYLTVFFAIWWAWMNFTWFASAYDTDDVPYRITTFIQITGALILAAGIPRAFDSVDLSVITLGYVVMRLAMVTQWLRAAYSDPGRRATALRFAVGITLLQVGWVARLALPESWRIPAIFVLVAVELAVPVVAERAGRTSWHPRHISERYGLFTIIMLGESILAATLALQTAVDAGHSGRSLIFLAVAGLVIVFCMWWLYFDRPAHELLDSARSAFRWGEGHYFVFASAGAVGAGLAVAVDHEIHVAHVSATLAGYAIALPVAVYLLAVWLLHIRPRRQGVDSAAYLVVAALVLVAPFLSFPIQMVAALLTLLVIITVLIAKTRRVRPSSNH